MGPGVKHCTLLGLILKLERNVPSHGMVGTSIRMYPKGPPDSQMS